jgi:hypothetical protein
MQFVPKRSLPFFSLCADDRATVHYGGLKDLYEASVLRQLVGGTERSDRLPLKALSGLRKIGRVERVGGATRLLAVRALLDELLQSVFMFQSSDCAWPPGGRAYVLFL